MFTVKIGPVTYDVECELFEAHVEDTKESLDRIEKKIDQLLGEAPGSPRIEFTIGPIKEL